MKTQNLLMLSATLSGALLLTACNRNSEPAATPDSAATPADSAAMPADTSVPPATQTPPTSDAMQTPMPASNMPASDMPATGAAPKDSGMTFAQMDKNADGGVVHDELTSGEMLDQHFSMADANKDGKLSAEEVEKHRADMAAKPGG